jgi:hypothetical protein
MAAMPRNRPAQPDLFAPAEATETFTLSEEDRAARHEWLRRELDAIDAKLRGANAFPFRDLTQALLAELFYERNHAELPEGRERYAWFRAEMERVYEIENRRLGLADTAE